MLAIEPHGVELYSPLPPEECAALLSAAVARESFGLRLSNWSGSSPVTGKVTGTSFRLRKNIRYSNSMQNQLTATMRPEGTGTVISGKFGLNSWVRIHLIIWFGGVTIFGTLTGVIFVASLFSKNARSEGALFSILVPLIMLTFGFATFRFGRYLARNEPQFLIAFLVQRLNATERVQNQLAHQEVTRSH